jgi:hypothetical protein
MTRSNQLKIIKNFLWNGNLFNPNKIGIINNLLYSEYTTNEPRELGFENKNILALKDRGLLVGIFPDKT